MKKSLPHSAFSIQKWIWILCFPSVPLVLAMQAQTVRLPFDLKPALLGKAIQMKVTREGKRLDCAVLVAPVTATVPLSVVAGVLVLHVSATPVFNIGDGFDMSIYVKGAAPDRQVYTRYFDPGRRAGDRKWTSISIPIEFQDGDSALEIRLSGGPQDDLVDDWLALTRVELLAGVPK